MSPSTILLQKGPSVVANLCGISELARWQKALMVGGGLAAAAVAAWYVYSETEDALKEAQEEEVLRFYKVVDHDMGINLRTEPETSSAGTAYVLVPGEAFQVSQVVRIEKQEYLRLADGRGWAFTRSPKTHAVICESCTEQEVREAGGTALDQVEAMLRSSIPFASQEALTSMAQRVLLAKEEMPKTESD
mmetsp:Transcript_35160/g.81037  ORF Transcript_35160/g.81037 Transcript_35160/m.81037 type:complete len:190 (-) Transcript_35160:134-703(-)